MRRSPTLTAVLHAVTTPLTRRRGRPPVRLAAALAIVLLPVVVLGNASAASARPAARSSAPTASQAGTANAALAAVQGGGCRPIYGISVCISYDTRREIPLPDFYVNSLAGLPSGTRFQVLVRTWYGHELAFVTTGVLDHTGHYGPYPTYGLLRGDGFVTTVAIFDPLGNVLYYAGNSPYVCYNLPPGGVCPPPDF